MGPMQNRESFVSYRDHELTVSFTFHLASLDATSSGTDAIQGAQQHLRTGTSPDCLRGHARLMLRMQRSSELHHLGAVRLRYDWEVFKRKRVAESQVKHQVLRRYKQDWSLGHEKGQCEPGGFL